MVTRELLLLSVSVIAILVSSAIFAAMPAIPFASAQAQAPREERNWEYINHDVFQTNFNPQTKVNKDNIQFLELKWIFPFPPSSLSQAALPGALLLEGASGPPLIVDGIVYMINNNQRITALDAKSGKTLWTYQVEANAEKAMKEQQIYRLRSHSHGINYIDGLVYINTMPCRVLGLDGLTGKVVVSVENLCKDIPTNSGLYKGGGYGSNPPVIDHKRGVLIWGVGGDQEGVTGARTFAAGIDTKLGKVLWRKFIQPPSKKDFPTENKQWHDMLVNDCKKGWIQGFSACEIPKEALLNDWGDMRRNTGISDFWGNWPLDEETGIVYMGSAQPGPEWNHTYTPGPNLISAAVIALDTATGEIKWYHQTTTHDLWDFDCSWNIVLGKIADRKVIYKGCKNGVVFALDAATGQPIWLFDTGSKCVYPTSNAKGAYPDGVKITYGNALNRYPWTCLLDPRDPASYNVKWQREPLTDGFWQNPPGVGAIEGDEALAYGNLYLVVTNRPGYQRIGPTEVFGVDIGLVGLPAPFTPKENTTVFALDAATGEIKWRAFIDNAQNRGGVYVTGGLAMVGTSDGTFRAYDATNGKLVWSKEFGTAVNVLGSTGFDADGKPKAFIVIGGKTGAGSGSVGPGALLAYGLPDKLPEPQVITKEVVKEVIKEVPKEVVRTETKTVTVETISPISYAAIGIGIVLVVIAGVLFTRRKKA